MKTRLLFCLFLISIAIIPAFAVNDSTMTAPADTVRTLGEVVVKASNIKRVKNGLSVVPNTREKRSATDGTDLLQRMMIPTIIVDGVRVTNTAGQAVKFFIDSIPATDRQVAGLRGRDVKRVEVLENPADPRFEGARAVVNYITVKWEYGGYTNLTATQKLPQPEGVYDVYSKFTKGKSTIDFNGIGRWYKYNGGQTWVTDKLYFPEAKESGKDYYTRESYSKEGKLKGSTYGLGMSWQYLFSQSSWIVVNSGLANENNPGRRSTGTVSYDMPGQQDMASLQIRKSRYAKPYASATYTNLFKSGAYMSAYMKYDGTFSRVANDFTLTGSEITDRYMNNVRERNNKYALGASFSLPLRGGRDHLAMRLAGGRPCTARCTPAPPIHVTA
ncbi:MAG: hypothetical protein NC043_04560 [Muribaculaceae bacterium]|nr:hypothetical protein [Muribaculaceae bacterium]